MTANFNRCLISRPTSASTRSDDQQPGRVGGEARDPLRVAMPEALPIPREQLAAFKARSADLNRQIELLRSVGAG